jgi:hypothetical protein
VIGEQLSQVVVKGLAEAKASGCPGRMGGLDPTATRFDVIVAG